MLKYQELIYDLNSMDYSVYILDHRGQGYSSRLSDDVQLGHVNNFFNYVLDLKYFVNKIIDAKTKESKMILFGHSMGGTVASLYAQNYKHDFNGLVLSSPMHQIQMINDYITDLSCYIMQKSSFNREAYMPKTASYDASNRNFATNKFTHSKIRYEIVEHAYESEPETKIGGPSVGWFTQACTWSKKSVADADKIEVPVLLLQAGEDSVVSGSAQEEFCVNAAQVCQLKKLQNSYHEIFLESDTVRDEALEEMLEFISKI